MVQLDDLVARNPHDQTRRKRRRIVSMTTSLLIPPGRVLAKEVLTATSSAPKRPRGGSDDAEPPRPTSKVPPTAVPRTLRRAGGISAVSFARRGSGVDLDHEG